MPKYQRSLSCSTDSDDHDDIRYRNSPNDPVEATVSTGCTSATGLLLAAHVQLYGDARASGCFNIARRLSGK